MSDFETSGRAWLRGAIDQQTLSLLDSASDATRPGARLSLSGEVGTALTQVADALTPFLPMAFATRLVAFDKNPTANWGVPWHQDRVIAVREKADVPEFTNWSSKAGMTHCEPPRAVLDNMLFVRLHLDDEDAETGPMQIALGSHHSGLVPAANAEAVAEEHQIETCIGQRGDILVLKMLTLHRSSPATTAKSRRVLRVDFANSPLPHPLEWGIGTQ